VTLALEPAEMEDAFPDNWPTPGARVSSVEGRKLAVTARAQPCGVAVGAGFVGWQNASGAGQREVELLPCRPVQPAFLYPSLSRRSLVLIPQ
jgi:hypothetical protein